MLWLGSLDGRQAQLLVTGTPTATPEILRACLRQGKLPPPIARPRVSHVSTSLTFHHQEGRRGTANQEDRPTRRRKRLPSNSTSESWRWRQKARCSATRSGPRSSKSTVGVLGLASGLPERGDARPKRKDHLREEKRYILWANSVQPI